MAARPTNLTSYVTASARGNRPGRGAIRPAIAPLPVRPAARRRRKPGRLRVPRRSRPRRADSSPAGHRAPVGVVLGQPGGHGRLRGPGAGAAPAGACRSRPGGPAAQPPRAILPASRRVPGDQGKLGAKPTRSRHCERGAPTARGRPPLDHRPGLVTVPPGGMGRPHRSRRSASQETWSPGFNPCAAIGPRAWRRPARGHAGKEARCSPRSDRSPSGSA